MWNRLALILLTASLTFAGDLTGKWSGVFEELKPDGATRGAGGAYMDLKLFLEGLFDRPVDLVLADAIKPRLRSPILEDVVHAPGL